MMKLSRRMAFIGLCLVILLGALGCDKPGEFKYGIVDLGLGFVAKGYCSCLYVTKQTEAFCRDYASLEQVSPNLSHDREKKTTRAALFLIYHRDAKYLGPDRGCQVN